MKHNIGDFIYWVYSSTNYQKEIPCPMCFGKLFVTIILGDNSESKIECGYCQKGYERASGIATVWEAVALVKSGEISGVSTRNGTKYEVGYETLMSTEIFTSKKEAEAHRKVRYEEEILRANKWFKDNFVNAKKSQTWSTGYHRNCIKSAEKTISWHKDRLCMIKEKKSL